MKENFVDLGENIANTLADYARENYPSFYYLAYSYMKNSEKAADLVLNIIYTSLSNGRKLRDLPPMKTWYFQLLTKQGMRAMFRERDYKRDFTDDSQIYALMETIEPSSTNVFKLYYFEEMGAPQIAAILNMKEGEVQGRLENVRRQLKIDSSLDEESMHRLGDLRRVYFSPAIPESLEKDIDNIIQEESQHNQAHKTRTRLAIIFKPLGLIILLFATVFLTVMLAESNPAFRESISQIPIIGDFFNSLL